MKPKKAHPQKDEPGIMSFIPKMKPTEKGVASNIEHGDEKIKQGIENLMTALFENLKTGLPKLARLQREAREGRDG